MRRCVASLVSLLCLCVSPAAAQPCSATLYGLADEFGIAGSNTNVQQTVVWDRDGSGPIQPVLVALSTAASSQFGQAVGAIAAWNGTRWSEIPLVLNGFPTTLLGVYQNKLIVGGNFTTISGVAANRIALFDGTTWSPISAGLPVAPVSTFEHQGSLYIGGPFNIVGGVAANGIVRWDGTQWRSLAGGVGGIAMPQVNAMTADGDDIIAVGAFETAGAIVARSVARYSPSLNTWQAIGTVPTTARPDGVAIFNDEIYISGAGSGPAGSLVSLLRYDGQTWGYIPGFDGAGTADSIAVIDNILHIGMLSNTGNNRSSIYCRWDGESFSNIVSGPQFDRVTSVVKFRDRIIAAGTFDTFGPTGCGRNIAILAPFGVEPLGPGLSFPDFPRITDLFPDGDSIYVAGDFNAIGARNIRFLARRDAAGNYESMGVDFPVEQVIKWDENPADSRPAELVAVIQIAATGSDNRWSVIRLRDGRWESLLRVLVSTSIAQLPRLAVYQGDLILAGQFSQIVNNNNFTVTAESIARYRNGVWLQFGGGLRNNNTPATVRAIAEFDGQLFVGGNITNANNNSVPVTNSARWDGTAWVPLTSAAVMTDMQVFDNRLYAVAGATLLAWEPGFTNWSTILSTITTGDTLSTALGSLFIGRNRLTGTTLTAFDSTLNGGISDIVDLPDGRILIAGGTFNSSSAPNRNIPGLIAWAPAGFTPVATSLPVSQTVCLGEPAAFTINIEQSEQTAYRWFRNGEPVVNTRTLSGAGTNALRFAAVSPSDTGTYRVVVTNACGVLTSSDVTLAINPACPASCDSIDFNGNGVFPEEQDVIDFFSVLAGGDCQ